MTVDLVDNDWKKAGILQCLASLLGEREGDAAPKKGRVKEANRLSRREHAILQQPRIQRTLLDGSAESGEDKQKLSDGLATTRHSVYFHWCMHICRIEEIRKQEEAAVAAAAPTEEETDVAANGRRWILNRQWIRRAAPARHTAERLLSLVHAHLPD